MSRARFSDADVYLFDDCSGGFTCCACALKSKAFQSHSNKTIFGLLFHCLRHTLNGHKVPGYTYNGILRDIFHGYWVNPPMEIEKEI